MSDQAALAPGAGRGSALLKWLLAGLLLGLVAPASAAPLKVAVASNFLAPLEALADVYHQRGGPALQISAGATGQLYAQITQGAPYDVFLAADQARPQRLVAEGAALADSRMTYARGRLVLWARPGVELPVNGLAGLQRSLVTRLAIANPALAPYGRAAREALQASGQWSVLSERIVQGQNVGQALQYLATGNVSHALVAASYTRLDEGPAGDHQPVDAQLYAPIRQDAVILSGTASADQARAFLAFLRGPAAADVLASFGYRPAGGSR
ncbi:molybdate ABC transporter substrate-binding protein [Spiribacter aquaticus]|uniref:Molybdate ABC transporter substrate-binding protein n=1 Tax=Spiribacter aquaticus TaxID=1935996 RepID=A0A557RN10_9GAMM|nr:MULTISPECIES: molybdate ABC transporter substrate-binding protein [Spiribacter]TVO66475.1 molybdate ABC transporter substrate-binding protein [Spiribacter aquaticus]